MEASQDPQTQDSQLESTQDSQLQTTQPDQPVPSEPERQEQVADEVETYPTTAEQQAAHDQREQGREQLRREHNARTGGGEIKEGEVQAQRDEHNARTAGTATSSDGVDGSQDQN